MEPLIRRLGDESRGASREGRDLRVLGDVTSTYQRPSSTHLSKTTGAGRTSLPGAPTSPLLQASKSRPAKRQIDVEADWAPRARRALAAPSELALLGSLAPDAPIRRSAAPSECSTHSVSSAGGRRAGTVVVGRPGTRPGSRDRSPPRAMSERQMGHVGRDRAVATWTTDRQAIPSLAFTGGRGELLAPVSAARTAPAPAESARDMGRTETSNTGDGHASNAGMSDILYLKRSRDRAEQALREAEDEARRLRAELDAARSAKAMREEAAQLKEAQLEVEAERLAGELERARRAGMRAEEQAREREEQLQRKAREAMNALREAREAAAKAEERARRGDEERERLAEELRRAGGAARADAAAGAGPAGSEEWQGVLEGARRVECAADEALRAIGGRESSPRALAVRVRSLKQRVAAWAQRLKRLAAALEADEGCGDAAGGARSPAQGVDGAGAEAAGVTVVSPGGVAKSPSPIRSRARSARTRTPSRLGVAAAAQATPGPAADPPPKPRSPPNCFLTTPEASRAPFCAGDGYCAQAAPRAAGLDGPKAAGGTPWKLRQGCDTPASEDGGAATEALADGSGGRSGDGLRSDGVSGGMTTEGRAVSDKAVQLADGGRHDRDLRDRVCAALAASSDGARRGWDCDAADGDVDERRGGVGLGSPDGDAEGGMGEEGYRAVAERLAVDVGAGEGGLATPPISTRGSLDGRPHASPCELTGMAPAVTGSHLPSRCVSPATWR